MKTGRISVLVFLLCIISIPQNIWSQRITLPHTNDTNSFVETINFFKSHNSGISPNPETRENNSNNYFRIDNSEKSLWNGKHWDSNDYPLKVYVKSCSSKFFKTLYRNYIDYAFGIWENADNRIKFIYTARTTEADIIIMFEENLITKYDDSYLGITGYAVNDEKLITKSIIEIGLLKFNYEPVSDGEIKATIIHELGHSLGLGHSDNENDIMFPFIDPMSGSEMYYKDLSQADIAAVKSVINLGF